MTRRMSLELKLTLLMSVVLATVLTIAMIAVDATLRRFAVSRVEDRLFRATRQLATVAATGIANVNARYVAAAADTGVRRALLRGDTSGVGMTLQRLAQPTDSGLPIELWTPDGRRIALVGRDVRPELAAAGRPELPDQFATVVEPRARAGADSVRLTPLYVENGLVRFWMVKPIVERGRTIGYIAHQRRITMNPQAQQTLRDLSGDSVSLYYRNVDNSLWASATGHPTMAFSSSDSASRTAYSSEGEQLLFEEERIGATPLMIGMRVPLRTVVAGPLRLMRSLFMLGVLLFALGAFATWSVGRSIARPLGQVTRAAGELAAGHYDTRVPEEGDPEIRRLAESFNHMASEVGASRLALVEQTRRAEAASSAKSEFLTTMSHELRTPLNAIGGYVELLEMELRGPITDPQRRDLQRIRASQQHLLGLISSVLDLARIEAGRVTYDLVNIPIHRFLSELDALIGPQAAAKQITVDLVAGLANLTVLADHEKLRQVVLNLLSNAIRHTPPGGRITLSAAPRGNVVAIVVADTGPGIPAERHEEVFEPFVQLDRSLARTREGLGLGLAISRDLARGMGGDLVVEAHPGDGARFVLTLPPGDARHETVEPHTGELRAGTVTT